MRVVADAAVLAKTLVPEAESDKARELLDEWMSGRLSLLAPGILPAEVANVLWRRVCCNLLTIDEATQLYTDFARLGIPLVPTEELIPEALEFALCYKQSVYDCLHLALAHETGSILVTADARMAEAMRAAPVEVRLLGEWPTWRIG